MFSCPFRQDFGVTRFGLIPLNQEIILGFLVSMASVSASFPVTGKVDQFRGGGQFLHGAPERGCGDSHYILSSRIVLWPSESRDLPNHSPEGALPRSGCRRQWGRHFGRRTALFAGKQFDFSETKPISCLDAGHRQRPRPASKPYAYISQRKHEFLAPGHPACGNDWKISPFFITWRLPQAVAYEKDSSVFVDAGFRDRCDRRNK